MDGFDVCRGIRAALARADPDADRARRGARPRRRARGRRRRLRDEAVLAARAGRAHEGRAAPDASRAPQPRGSSSATSRSTPQAREVTVAGEPVELTGKEFDLLAYLLENPGIVFSREQLLDRVWGMTYFGGTRTVDVHVAQLRRKLGRPDADPHRPRRGLQGRPAVTLPRAAVRRDRGSWPLLSLALAFAIGAVLTRRAVERNTLRDVSAQVDLLVERERESLAPVLAAPQPAGVPRAPGRARRPGAARRLVAAPAAGARGRAPPRRAARRHAHVDGDALLLRRPARRAARASCSCGRPSSTNVAPGGRTSRALIIARARDGGARRARRVPARARDRAAGSAASPRRRRGLADSADEPPLVPVEGPRELARRSPRASTRSPSSSRRRARRSARSCSPSATS